MGVKNPPHPGRGVRENCLVPLGLGATGPNTDCIAIVV